MTRTEALKEAEALVDRLDPKRNDKGYDRPGAADLGARVRAVLDVADWLLAEPIQPAALLAVDFDE